MGRLFQLQLFNFAHVGKRLRGNPVDLSEQPERGHSVRCEEDTAVLAEFAVVGCDCSLSDLEVSVPRTLYVSCHISESKGYQKYFLLFSDHNLEAVVALS